MRRFGPIRIPVKPIPGERPMSIAGRIEALGRRNVTLAGELRAARRKEQKLQQRLNRIANLTPGRRRIWYLDEIANVLACEAMSEQEPEWMEILDGMVLYLHRLEWDLGELRDVVRGDKRMPGSRTDPTLWRGERP